ncbi:MAG TPA: EthD domain-containing protein [Acidimicrobiales bacterium]|nr:EthD domain-containing protein [Acidimicrobiales bacterium]
MIKLVYCLRRKPGMTWDEFSTYWREVHAPLVAERAEVLGIRKYVQVRTADNAAVHAAMQARNGGSPDPFDGVAELWFDDDALSRAPTPESAEASQELLDDEANFIDLPRSPIWFAQEWQVV